MKKRKKKRVKKSVKIFIVILLLAIGGTILFINKDRLFKKGPENNPTNPNIVDTPQGLQVVNPNSDTRPIAIMINNLATARQYHSGLQEAYLVYEIIVEGGITRFMALYKDADVNSIGSIRSSRAYFLDYVLENDAIYVHWGGSPGALDDISDLGINNIDGIYNENKYFYRNKDLNVSSEHTGYTRTKLINEGIDDLGYRKTTGKKLLLNYTTEANDLSQIAGAQIANTVEIPYSNYVTTSYEYDKDNKVYKRYVNDKAHTDYVTKKQYTVKNIITYKVSNATISNDDKGRQELDNLGKGEGYYISEGYAVPIIWEKKSRSSQTIYKYLNGEEIKVNDGNTFIQIQPTSQSLSIRE